VVEERSGKEKKIIMATGLVEIDLGFFLGNEKGSSGRRKRVVGGVPSGAGKSNVFLVAATMTKAQQRNRGKVSW
jgi:hypothetical protein